MRVGGLSGAHRKLAAGNPDHTVWRHRRCRSCVLDRRLKPGSRFADLDVRRRRGLTPDGIPLDREPGDRCHSESHGHRPAWGHLCRGRLARRMGSTHAENRGRRRRVYERRRASGVDFRESVTWCPASAGPGCGGPMLTTRYPAEAGLHASRVRLTTIVAAAAAIGVFALVALRATPAAQTDARPNIIVVLVDDMGWSDIGPYGGEIPTPNLDALAARGVRFTQFYSTPRCSPTRASLLTGVYPHQAGMGHLEDVIRRGSIGTSGRLNDRSVTIAEVLREAGYFTAMAGKWHLGQDNGSPPWQRGFDRVLSLRQGGMFFPNQNYQGGGDTLTRRAREPLYVDGAPMPRDSAMFGENWYATYLWTNFGLRFIDEARKANKPFFLYLPHNAPHFPLMAPAELIAKHRGRYKAGWDRLREERYRRQIRMGLIDARWPLSPREADSPAWETLSDDAKDRFDHLMAVYAAMVEAIDTSMGTLVKGLQARGALDNTLILFLSDNGANAESGPDGRFD